MELQNKKQQLLTSLEQIRTRQRQLQEELNQRQAQEQQVIGALMLIDDLLTDGQPALEPIP